MCGTRFQGHPNALKEGDPGKFDPCLLCHAGPASDAIGGVLRFAIHWVEEFNAEEIRTFVQDIVQIRDNYNFKTGVLVAAVRNARQVVEAGVANADIVTAGFDVYKTGFDHPYTQDGIKKFANFWDMTQYE